MKYYLDNSLNEIPYIIENSFSMEEGSYFYFENARYCVLRITKSLEGEESGYCIRVDENARIVVRNEKRLANYKFRFFCLFEKFNIVIDEKTVTEKQLTQAFCTLFKNDFDIIENVWGVHYTGKKVCLDLMLIPKDTSELRNEKITIGIEIKNPFTYGSKGRRSSDLFAQCLDYAQSKFGVYENVIILLCPMLPGYEDEYFLSRFLSRFNVGHVLFDEKSFTFKLGQETFWSSKKGFGNFVKKSMMELKVGNRSAKSGKRDSFFDLDLF